MEPIVLVEGEDLARLLDYFDDARQGPRPYRLRFAIDGGIKVKTDEDVWTIDFGQIEVPGQAVSLDDLAQDIRGIYTEARDSDAFDSGARWALRTLARHVSERIPPTDGEAFTRDALRVRADS
jgi:hypothetical protein